jgi:hypothetical protein
MSRYRLQQERMKMKSYELHVPRQLETDGVLSHLLLINCVVVRESDELKTVAHIMVLTPPTKLVGIWVSNCAVELLDASRLGCCRRVTFQDQIARTVRSILYEHAQ